MKHPANIYFFKLNNKNTRKKCEICSNLTIKTPEQRLSWAGNTKCDSNFCYSNFSTKLSRSGFNWRIQQKALVFCRLFGSSPNPTY